MNIGALRASVNTTSVIGGLAFLLIASTGSSVYFYRELALVRSDPSIVGRQEAAALVAVVGRVIALPEGEVPTVATVVDPEKLKSQAFFDKAKKGDKILIYSGAKKAFLFDPIANKVIDVAPVNLGSSSPAEQ